MIPLSPLILVAFLTAGHPTLAAPTHDSALSVPHLGSDASNTTLQYEKCQKGGVYCFSEIANMGTSTFLSVLSPSCQPADVAKDTTSTSSRCSTAATRTPPAASSATNGAANACSIAGRVTLSAWMEMGGMSFGGGVRGGSVLGGGAIRMRWPGGLVRAVVSKAWRGFEVEVAE